MKKIYFLLILPLVFAISCVRQESLTSYSVEITPNMIDNYLKKEFPIEKKLKIGKLILKDPEAQIEQKEDKVKLGTTIVLKLPFVSKQTGKVYISGKVAFNQKTKELYLVNPSIEKLVLNNSNILKYLPSEGKQMISDVVKEVLSQVAIYKVDDKSITGKLVKDIKIQNGKLLITFGL